MPLTAINWADEIILAQDLNEFDRNSDYYTCKSCYEEMILVLPKTDRINHFRHKPGSNCKYASESIKHLEAKMFFYNVYLKKYPKQDIELEKRVGDRVGDLVVGDTVIEIQNSSISETEIDERFNDWNNAGYQMLWVITDNVISPDHIGEKRIPNWVSKLHKIYKERVYLYSNKRIYEIHFYQVYRPNDWTGGFNYLKTIKELLIKEISNIGIIKNGHRISQFFDEMVFESDKEFFFSHYHPLYSR